MSWYEIKFISERTEVSDQSHKRYKTDCTVLHQYFSHISRAAYTVQVFRKEAHRTKTWTSEGGVCLQKSARIFSTLILSKHSGTPPNV